LTVLEANACGVPVVASRRPGLVDSVVHAETGWLVPYGDARAFAAAALDFLRDPAKRAAYGERARDWARRFTWEDAAVQTERVLLRAVGGSAALAETNPLASHMRPGADRHRLRVAKKRETCRPGSGFAGLSGNRGGT
jgi:hypothetical protein